MGVLEEVAEERARQDREWGIQYHELAVWALILTEEVGEVCKAILEARSGRALDDVRMELVQVAAVAASMVEAIDEQRTEAGEWVSGSFIGAHGGARQD